MKKLNLGCGNDIKKGWINLDSVPLHGVDVVHNLNKTPYPFKNEEFDLILCKDVLEHLNNLPKSLKELHRILKKGGKLKISVPHFNSPDSCADPTHKNRFSSKTFLFFMKGYGRNYYFKFSFKKVKVKITFLKKIYLPYNYVLEFLVNINDKTRLFYESTPLKLFPSFNLEIEMDK